jgi:hypothetical protein
MNQNKKDEISELIVILTSSVSIWFYLYNLIIEESSKNQFNDAVLGYSVSHFLIFVNSIVSLIILYKKTLSNSSLEKKHFININKISEKLENYLYSLWFPITFLSLINVALYNFNFNIHFKFILLFNLILSIFITILFFSFLLNFNFKKIVKIVIDSMRMTILGLSLSYFFYLPFMILISSNVEIELKNDINKSNEDIIFIVKRKGYIFLPYLESIKYNNKTKVVEKGSDNAYKIDKRNLQSDTHSLLEIEIKQQMTNKSIKKHIEIPLVK